jgi:DNA repair exonuclease SbcCD ATPase subunit
MNELQQKINVRRRELDKQQGEARALALRGKSLQAEIEDLKQRLSTLEKVAILLNSIGEERQLKAQTTIENLVTLGLQTIFGPELSFHLIQKTSANKVQVDFIIRSTYGDNIIDTDVLSARGGGLAATVGFLLRLVILLLSKSEQPFLVLDEVFAHLSEEYLDATARFLKEITVKTNVQIIMVTHQQELAECADAVYRFTLDDKGHTKVKREV